MPTLQREVGEVVAVDFSTSRFTAILEYELPMESRRIDALFLLRNCVLIIELKGKSHSTDADIDQAFGYARDLRYYHRDCHGRKVTPVLVPEQSKNQFSEERGVTVCSPDRLDELVATLSAQSGSQEIDAGKFLSADAYKPLPSLVRAARELFINKRPPQLWKSIAKTDRAVRTVREVIAHSYENKKRALVLLMGVPGAGKTLVGLRIAHEAHLDNLVGNDHGANSIFLSGNGPLVKVLQHILKSEESDGKTFVRPIKEYIRHYGGKKQIIPKEHVVIFDEAQRAHDSNQVAQVHKIDSSEALSEPEYFIRIADRAPDWFVLIGLLGHGQEINVGEEGGLKLWFEAIHKSSAREDWKVFGPAETADALNELNYQEEPSLSLDESIRSHFALRLHQFVSQLVEQQPDSDFLEPLAEQLKIQGHDLRITRCLDTAKQYLLDRYADYPESRFGMIASSRDKFLESVGVPNGYQATKNIKIGPWYSDDANAPNGLSCKNLEICITEYEAQGLELDAVLLPWGTDFVLKNGKWSIKSARNYHKNRKVINPFQIRANAYRVLLTRGRDAHVVFVPEINELDETWEFLCRSGFRSLCN